MSVSTLIKFSILAVVTSYFATIITLQQLHLTPAHPQTHLTTIE